MNEEHSHETPRNAEELGPEAFDFDTFDFNSNGFDELKLAEELNKHVSELYEMLIAGRKHNQNVLEDGREKFSQRAVGGRMVGAPSQSYVSQLEHGLVNLVDTLTSYALAAGLNVSYSVSSAVDGMSLAHETDVPSSETHANTFSMAYNIGSAKSEAEKSATSLSLEALVHA